MKKLTLAFLAVLAVSVSPAQASTFTLESYDVSLHTTGSGLQVWEEDVLNLDGQAALTFALTALNPVYTVEKLFTLGTNEKSVEADDWTPYSIAVNFDFSQPLPGFGGDAQGVTGAINLIAFEFAYVDWDNPLRLSFGSNGLMDVYLSEAAFSVPGSTTIGATFKLVREDTGGPIPTPEPASGLLIGLGAAGASLIRRRRRTV